MTYERGKAPDGAPVTWTPSGLMAALNVSGKVTVNTYCVPIALAELICRAFHLAQLAKEARSIWDSMAILDDDEREWCKTFDAVSGDRP